MRLLLKCRSLFAFVGLLVLLSGNLRSGGLTAQALLDQEAWYRTRGLLLIADIRTDIIRSAPEMAALDRAIRYRVVPHAAFMAYAQLHDGRSITVSSGAVQALDWVSTILASVFAFGNYCPMQYLAEYADLHRSNTLRVGRRLPVEPIVDPLSWMSMHCQRLDRTAFMEHPTANIMDSDRYKVVNFIGVTVCNSIPRETHRGPARVRPSVPWSP